MLKDKFHQEIIEYYDKSEDSYRTAWDLNNSLAMHYGYKDDNVKSFAESLMKMNEVMMKAAEIKSTDKVLDAGCGVGGTSIYLALNARCEVYGITLSSKQVNTATENARRKKVDNLVRFREMDYCKTDFPDHSFDVVLGCESVCHALNKEDFIKEAYRLLKPSGRLLICDGFVASFEDNKHPLMQKFLNGFKVNYLESTERFQNFMSEAGFKNTATRDLTKEVSHSSRRMYKIQIAAKIFFGLRRLLLFKPMSAWEKGNLETGRAQYFAIKKGIMKYAIVTGKK